MRLYNIIRCRLLFVLAALIALPCLKASAQSDLSAREVLDRAAEAYRSSGGVEISFTVSSDGGESSGNIRLKGDKFVLDAGGLVTWYDGNTQWTYLEQNDEVNVSNPTAEELQTLNPYAWLDMYKHGYSLQLDANTSVAGVYKVVMTTTDLRRQDLQSIVVMIDQSTFYPRLVTMAGNGGRDVVVIRIDSFSANHDFPDGMFTFDSSRYPNAEIVDLR